MNPYEPKEPAKELTNVEPTIWEVVKEYQISYPGYPEYVSAKILKRQKEEGEFDYMISSPKHAVEKQTHELGTAIKLLAIYIAAPQKDYEKRLPNYDEG